MTTKLRIRTLGFAVAAGAVTAAFPVTAQLRDVTQNPDIVGVPGHPADSAGIGLSFEAEQGSSPNDHGSVDLAGSSRFIISRDPARAIRRGRQLFQRKFTIAQGNGPTTNDGIGSSGADVSRSAGFADSCAACHGRPRGSAGFGGDVATRPDSRDAPHLFGLGLQEMLADEITQELRTIRAEAVTLAQLNNATVTRTLKSKGIAFGSLTANPDGSVDGSGVVGINQDLRVRPFFAQGGTMSIREFLVGAFNAEMGLESPDIDLINAQTTEVVTPAGMVLDGRIDFIENAPVQTPEADSDADGVTNEIPVSIVDFMEFYLLHYFKAAIGKPSQEATLGRILFTKIGCTSCHVPNLTIDRDRRVADVETNFNAMQGNPLNRMFAVATLSVVPDPAVPATESAPGGLLAAGNSFVVRSFFADFKRHNLGPNFAERNYVNFVAQVSGFSPGPGAPLPVEPPPVPPFNFVVQHITEPLWGVGDTPPYGHDGRTGNLEDVILRHGGEADVARAGFVALPAFAQGWLITFLRSLVLFSPDDTASNLLPANSATPGFPQIGHGAIALGQIFRTPGPE
ncbi:MAG TPA: di-heme oxidoredictase family protein [Polyangiaceae bacterium]|nr:di-heme oxidoredictase family protein [Polyangiaceae bacterium]